MALFIMQLGKAKIKHSNLAMVNYFMEELFTLKYRTLNHHIMMTVSSLMKKLETIIIHKPMTNLTKIKNLKWVRK